MANVHFRINCTTTFHLCKMCVCSRDHSYLTWSYFDNPLKTLVLWFCGFWLSRSVHIHKHPQLQPADCQTGFVYRTVGVEASLVNWSHRYWSLKWITVGCSLAELQEVLAVVLVFVMFKINRYVPWLQVLWLQMLNLHCYMLLVQDESCWDRKWVTVAAFSLRVDYSRVAIE